MKRAFPWLYSDSSQPIEEGRLVITGEKVVLREKSVGDASDDYTWRTDDELSRLDATRPITMPYDAFLRYSREETQYSSLASKRLAIDTLDGVHIGNCMYYDINHSRGEAELGIMIGDRRYWGEGYGTDAVKTLLTFIFTTTDLSRVYLHTLKWNDRARQSFIKAGFQEIGEVFRSGFDFIKMEVRRDHWAAPNSIVTNTEDEGPQVNGLHA